MSASDLLAEAEESPQARAELGSCGSCTFPKAGTFGYTDPTEKANAFKGTVKVEANKRAVSLTSSRSLLIFGGATTLSGTISSKQAGKHVTVVAQPAGESAWQTEVTTTSGGDWSLRVQPRIRTTYHASFQGASSTSVVVNVRPRVSVQKVGSSRFLIVVLAAHSMGGKTVDVARLRHGDWVTMEQLQLHEVVRTSTIAVNTFTSHVRLGTKLRVFLPASQLSPDYADGHSNFVVR